MAITVLVAATNTRLAKLADLKSELGISGGAQDAELTARLDEATDILRRFTHREFVQQTYRETLPGHGGTVLMLARTPIASVSTVLNDGSPITDYTIEEPEAGFLQRQAGWATGELVGWNITPFFVPTRPVPNFTVDYVAGWKVPDDAAGGLRLPNDLVRACLEVAKLLYRSKTRDNAVASKTVDDLSLTFRNLGADDLGLLSAAGVLGIVRPYVRVAH